MGHAYFIYFRYYDSRPGSSSGAVWASDIPAVPLTVFVLNYNNFVIFDFITNGKGTILSPSLFLEAQMTCFMTSYSF